MSNLLIEPVWNRNIARWTLNAHILLLLIEPVWNRNDCNGFCIVVPKETFNRTSME